MKNNYKRMSSKRLAFIIWGKVWPLLVNLYVIVAVTHFILMGLTSTGISGPTSIGTFLLGQYTYTVAHALFYMGACIGLLMMGLVMALVVLVLVTNGK